MPTTALKIAVYPPPSRDLPFMIVAIFPSGDVTAMQAANEAEASQMAGHLVSEMHVIAEQQRGA